MPDSQNRGIGCAGLLAVMCWPFAFYWLWLMNTTSPVIARLQRQAANYVHAPGCGQSGPVDPSVAPCTWESDTVASRQMDHGAPPYVVWIAVPGKAPEAVDMQGIRIGSAGFFDALRSGDPIRVQRWNGSVEQLVAGGKTAPAVALSVELAAANSHYHSAWMMFVFLLGVPIVAVVIERWPAR